MFFEFLSVLWIQIHGVRIWIQHFEYLSGFGSIPDQGFWWRKIVKNLLLKKTAIYSFLDHHKGRPSYRRSLQRSKKNIQHFNLKFPNFFYFWGSFLPSRIPDPDPLIWLNPDPKHIFLFYLTNLFSLIHMLTCAFKYRSKNYVHPDFSTPS